MKIINQNVDISKLLLKELPDFLSDVFVKGNFFCHNNQLTSLEGSPEKVERNFYCLNNSVKFTEEDVRKVCKVKGRVFV